MVVVGNWKWNSDDCREWEILRSRKRKVHAVYDLVQNNYLDVSDTTVTKKQGEIVDDLVNVDPRAIWSR